MKNKIHYMFKDFWLLDSDEQEEIKKEVAVENGYEYDEGSYAHVGLINEMLQEDALYGRDQYYKKHPYDYYVIERRYHDYSCGFDLNEETGKLDFFKAFNDCFFDGNPYVEIIDDNGELIIRTFGHDADAIYTIKKIVNGRKCKAHYRRDLIHYIGR